MQLRTLLHTTYTNKNIQCSKYFQPGEQHLLTNRNSVSTDTIATISYKMVNTKMSIVEQWNLNDWLLDCRLLKTQVSRSPLARPECIAWQLCKLLVWQYDATHQSNEATISNTSISLKKWKFYPKSRHIWSRVFKNGTSKICWKRL